MAKVIDASNLQSKVLYLVSGSHSMQMKKASGCHLLLINCLRTLPTAMSEATMESAIGASYCGCASMVASSSACLIALKACNMSSVQERREHCFNRCTLPENMVTSDCIS